MNTVFLAIERLSGLNWSGQITSFLVGLGHCGTHWPTGALYVLLPFITKQLGLSIIEVGTLMAAYYAIAAAVSFGGGALVDLTGRRVMVMIIALLMGGGALLAIGVVDRFVWLFVPVSLIGMATNLWHPPAISYLSQRFPRNRGYVLSIHAIGGTLGNAIAPPVVGAMVATLSWPLALSAGALPTIMMAVVIGIFFFVESRDASDGSLAARVEVRRYVREFLTILLDRVLLGVVLSIGFCGMMQAGLSIFLPFYMADVMKANPLWIGLALAFFQVGGIVTGPLFGTLSDRFGRKPVVVAGLTLATVCAVGLPVLGRTLNIYVFISVVFLLGSGSLGVRPALQSWVLDLIPPSLSGSATSLIFGVGGILAILAPMVGGVIAEARGLAFAFYFLAGAMLLANLLVLILPRTERSARSQN